MRLRRFRESQRQGSILERFSGPRRLQVALGSLLGCLGPVLGALGTVLGRSRGRLGRSWVAPGESRGGLGSLLGVFGPVLGALGSLLGGLGWSWGGLRASWAGWYRAARIAPEPAQLAPILPSESPGRTEDPHAFFLVDIAYV